MEEIFGLHDHETAATAFVPAAFNALESLFQTPDGRPYNRAALRMAADPDRSLWEAMGSTATEAQALVDLSHEVFMAKGWTLEGDFPQRDFGWGSWVLHRLLDLPLQDGRTRLWRLWAACKVADKMTPIEAARSATDATVHLSADVVDVATDFLEGWIHYAEKDPAEAVEAARLVLA